MGKFKNLVNIYMKSVNSMVKLNCRYPDIDSLQQKVLLHKLDKHHSNPRKSALYISLFRKEYGRIEISKINSYIQHLKLDLTVYKGVAYIGYPHSDKTYHYFDAGPK